MTSKQGAGGGHDGTGPGGGGGLREMWQGFKRREKMKEHEWSQISLLGKMEMLWFDLV